TDTLISTFYPPNAHKASKNVGPLFTFYASNASSLHPGGVNFAFADGSVRFIKDSVSCWNFTPNGSNRWEPVGVNFDSSTFIYTLNPGTQIGVYQALSTRNNGEVISSDSF